MFDLLVKVEFRPAKLMFITSAGMWLGQNQKMQIEASVYKINVYPKTLHCFSDQNMPFYQLLTQFVKCLMIYMYTCSFEQD